LEGLILFIHIIVCLLLVIVVLLQSGKSADLAGAFGGMGSQSTFAARGSATFMSKLTTTLAVLFMITSLTLWIVSSHESSSSTVLPADDGAKQGETTDNKGTEEGTTPQTGDDAKKDDSTGTTGNETEKTDAGTTDAGTTTATDPAKEKTDGTSGNADKKDSGNAGDKKNQGETKKPAETDKKN